MVTNKLSEELILSLENAIRQSIDFGMKLQYHVSNPNNSSYTWVELIKEEENILSSVEDNIDVLRQALTMERAERAAFEADSYRSG